MKLVRGRTLIRVLRAPVTAEPGLLQLKVQLQKLPEYILAGAAVHPQMGIDGVSLARSAWWSGTYAATGYGWKAAAAASCPAGDQVLLGPAAGHRKRVWHSPAAAADQPAAGWPTPASALGAAAGGTGSGGPASGGQF